jgi:putative transcriptional regulator
MKNRLRVLRAEKGWTQEELAQELGVSRQAVNALETEKHAPFSGPRVSHCGRMQFGD